MADDPKDDPEKDDPTPTPARGDTLTKEEAAELRAALRKANKEAETNRLRLKEIEDRDKTEAERLTEKVAQLEKDVVTATARADRYEVALEKGLDMTRAKRLTGSTREELEADADELQTWQAGNSEESKTPAKPTEALRGGGDPTGNEPERDMRQVVADIPRGF